MNSSLFSESKIVVCVFSLNIEIYFKVMGLTKSQNTDKCVDNLISTESSRRLREICRGMTYLHIHIHNTNNKIHKEIEEYNLIFKCTLL